MSAAVVAGGIAPLALVQMALPWTKMGPKCDGQTTDRVDFPDRL